MKFRSMIQTIAILLVLCFPSVSHSQQGLVSQQASDLIEKFMSDTGAPGIAVSVGVKGQIVWSDGFGFADVEQRIPIWPAITRFRVGSVAKPMTAVAIAQLHENGKLDLDNPIQQYVPTFPQKEGWPFKSIELSSRI